MKAVLDSSVLFSALLKKSRATAEVLALASNGCFDLWLSESILDETAASLLRKADRFDYTRQDVMDFIGLLRELSTIVADPPAIPPVCRDPKDDHILAAALAAQADIVVSGDDDLLSLGTYEGIRILSVRTFLDMLAQS